MKVDMLSVENEDLKRKMEVNRKKEAEIDKLKKQLEQLKEMNQKLLKSN